MIDTILFDLDGTLLPFSQDAFIGVYFTELKKVFVKLGFDADQSVAAVWAGTKAMIMNNGSQPNSQRFWQGFADRLSLDDEQVKIAEDACDSFYSNEFNVVKKIMEPTDIPKRLIKAMLQKGYSIVLATNPLFPMCGVESRMGWAGLDPLDFLHITNYSNSTFCKPNLGYYEEIFTKINKAPDQCIMIGNNPAEDMCARELGAATFLVTDCLENETGMDISVFQHGSLAELETYLTSFPDVG